jgi:hypothetical protein
VVSGVLWVIWRALLRKPSRLMEIPRLDIDRCSSVLNASLDSPTYTPE